jgi:hypothetical protein
MTFLDDAGADRASVFEGDDLLMLGLFPGGPGWGQPIRVLTANGPVLRDVVFLYLRWLTFPLQLDRQTPPLGTFWILVEAYVCPGFSFDPDTTRLSGMSIRRYLYTATAPNGAAMLHIAEKKNGFISRIPIN